MAILSFLVHLAGATMLLLFAVRMVRTGIERAFGASFNRLVTTPRPALSAAALGLFLAMILQSSAAVALLSAGFAGAGGLGFSTGLAVVLGADLGAALLIQLLSLPLDALVPLLLLCGGALFLKAEQRDLRQAGRIVLGIAFILISLRFLRETMIPIRDSDFLPVISAYLQRDYATAFLCGAALAFVMHSSVAAILMCLTAVAAGAIPAAVGLSLILGANLGSALIPLRLSRGMDPPGRRIVIANLGLRGAAAILALFVVNSVPVLDRMPAMPPEQQLVLVHILFNAALLLALPFRSACERPARALIADTAPQPQSDLPLHYRSFLDHSVTDKPAMALASLRREVLRMAQVVEEMITPVMELYSGYDRDRMKAIRAKDKIVNDAFDGVRRYSVAIDGGRMRKSERKVLRELLEYAIALEAAGDIVVRSLLPLTEEKHQKALRLSDEGLHELSVLHERVLRNMGLAAQVLLSNDVECARLLLAEKDEMRRLHRSSRKKHLQRLSQGIPVSMDSSDIHLETAHSFKEFNSQVTLVAYPILVREGQLLDTRLITGLDEEFADC